MTERERARFIEVADAAIRAAVHFAGEALQIVAGGLPPQLVLKTQIHARLNTDIRSMEQFIDHLRRNADD